VSCFGLHFLPSGGAQANCDFVITPTVGQDEGCPRIIQSKLLSTFTMETFNNGW